jgi:hypothetical protein
MPRTDEEVEEFNFTLTHGFGHFTERGTGGVNDSEVRPHVLQVGNTTNIIII